MLTVAVVIPLFNGEKYIEEAILSALKQDRPVEEIVVVDDGSSDRGPSIVQALCAEHISLKLVTKPNGGQASARNFGAAATACDLIAFLDQDDVWYPSHTRSLAEAFSDPQENIGWSYSNLDEVDSGGQMVRHGLLDFHANEHPKRSLHSCLAQDMHVFPTAAMISKKAFDTVGGFDEQFVGYEDDDLFLRIFRAGFKNTYTRKSLSKWRMHSGSTTFGTVMATSRMRYFKKLIRLYPDDPKLLRFYVRDLIAPRFVKCAIEEIKLAIYRRDEEGLKLALDQIQALSIFISTRHRTRIRAAAWLISFRAFQSAYRTAPGFLLRRFHGAFGM